MRLGQLARKYNLKQEQIVEFLDNLNPGMGPYHNNTKLSDQTEELIARHFNKSFGDDSLVDLETTESNDLELAGEQTEELTEEVRESEQPTEDLLVESSIQAELDPDLPVVEVQDSEEPEEEEVKAIETDKLIELLESEDEDVDLSDITLIKAPKKELEGLKVLGKIDLPEPKPKPVEKDESEELKPKTNKQKRQKRGALSPEEKEKRRLRAKQKKEAYEARQEKKRQEAEARRLKERKRAHYEQKIKQKKEVKVKPIRQQVEQDVEVVAVPPKPKSGLGRFWAWFWHGKKL